MISPLPSLNATHVGGLVTICNGRLTIMGMATPKRITRRLSVRVYTVLRA
jgi:hypothetical protein